MSEILIGGRTPEEIINKRLDELARSPLPLPAPGAAPPQKQRRASKTSVRSSPVISKFSIEELPDRYRLNNLQYKGDLWTVDWSKELLHGGHSHTQSDWANRTRTDEFKVAPGPIYGASIISVYDHRTTTDKNQKSLVKKVKKMFKDDFDPSKDHMMTSTHISYNPTAPDAITHWKGYSFGAQEDAVIIGPGGYLKKGFEDSLEALMGTNDVDAFSVAGKWLTGKKPYLHRLNSRPTNTTERVLVFGCYGVSNYFVIDAGSYISDVRPARGVVARRAQKNP